MREETAGDAAGRPVAYTIDGQGPAVVLLHAIGLDRSVWDPYRERLAAGHTVLAVDLPGHGGSAPLDDVELSAMAASVAAVLRHAGVAAAQVVGVSMGGMVAQLLAVAEPELVSALVLCATACTFPDAARAALRERGRAARETGMAGVTETTIERWFSPEGRTGSVAGQVRALLARQDPGYFAACWDAISRLDVAAGLAALDLPVLVLTGDADISLPPDAAETLARTGRDTTTVTVAGGCHLGAYEHPEPYRDAIEAFLATLPTHPSGAVLG